MLEPEVLISREALYWNLELLRKTFGNKALFPVIKANAYGHGLEIVVRLIEAKFSASEIPLLCVARLSEAARIRNAGGTRPLLILSERCPTAAEFAAAPPEARERLRTSALHWSVNSVADLRALRTARSAGQLPGLAGVHLNFNTGMNRLGFPSGAERWDQLLAEIAHCRRDGVPLVGLMSHLARGEESVANFSARQAREFTAALGEIRARWDEKIHGPFPAWIHLENSGGLARAVSAVARVPGVNAARPGLHVWGLEADPDEFASIGFRRVLQVRAPLRQAFWVEAGETIGYGGAHVCAARSLVGTFNIGYADGVYREFSNHAEIGLYVQGERVPIVGKVSMDLLTADLTRHSRAAEWAQRLAAGEMPAEWGYWICPQQSAQRIADASRTIPYEIVCSLSHRVARKVLEESAL